jgi:hypothetical protein
MFERDQRFLADYEAKDGPIDDTWLKRWDDSR